MRKSIIATTAALLSLSLAPLAASAQEVPSYAQTTAVDEQIRGRVVSFDGAYALTVSDDRGFTDNVELHDGTIINPTGMTLAPGMVVSILGDNAGNVFDANEVDTPYTVDAGVPFYSGHPWNYYGPTIGFDFFFNNTAWWHGNDGRHYAAPPVRVGFVQQPSGGSGRNGGDAHQVTQVRPVNTVAPIDSTHGTTFQPVIAPRVNTPSQPANVAHNGNSGNVTHTFTPAGGTSHANTSRGSGHESRR